MVTLFQPDRVLLHRQIEKFGEYLTGSILDVGSGGYDRYSNLLKHASIDIRLDPFESGNVDVVGTSDYLPFKKESFDGILCTQVLQYVKDPQAVIHEFYRVLRRPSRIILTIPQTNEIDAAPHEYYRFTSFGISSLLEKAGFEVIALEQRGGLFSTLGQQITRYFIDRLRLYDRNTFGRLAKLFLGVLGRAVIALDRLDRSNANRKHAIGWCVVAGKTASTGETPEVGIPENR